MKVGTSASNLEMCRAWSLMDTGRSLAVLLPRLFASLALGPLREPVFRVLGGSEFQSQNVGYGGYA